MKKAARADTRQRAITAYLNRQGTQAQIAELYDVHLRTFQRWLARFRENGEIAPRRRGGRHSVFEQDKLQELDQLVQQHPDATLQELLDLSGADGSIMAVKRALDRLGYRFKKNAPRQRTRT